MPQAILPLFTEEMTIVNLRIGVLKREGMVYYFQGMSPFYQQADITSQNTPHQPLGR